MSSRQATAGSHGLQVVTPISGHVAHGGLGKDKTEDRGRLPVPQGGVALEQSADHGDDRLAVVPRHLLDRIGDNGTRVGGGVAVAELTAVEAVSTLAAFGRQLPRPSSLRVPVNINS